MLTGAGWRGVRGVDRTRWSRPVLRVWVHFRSWQGQWRPRWSVVVQRRGWGWHVRWVAASSRVYCIQPTGLAQCSTPDMQVQTQNFMIVFSPLNVLWWNFEKYDFFTYCTAFLNDALFWFISAFCSCLVGYFEYIFSLSRCNLNNLCMPAIAVLHWHFSHIVTKLKLKEWRF